MDPVKGAPLGRLGIAIPRESDDPATDLHRQLARHGLEPCRELLREKGGVRLAVEVEPALAEDLERGFGRNERRFGARIELGADFLPPTFLMS